MRELSEPKKNRIVDLLFCGKTYREIAAEENVSIGAVSKVYTQFVGAAEESSLGETATKCGVEDTVGGLLELARECADKRVPVKSLLSAVRLIRFMESRRLKASQLEDCLKMCDKHSNDWEGFTSKAIELWKLERETRKSYRNVVDEYPTLVRKRKAVLAEVKGLEKKRKQEQEDFDHELLVHRVTRKEIPYAFNLKKALTEYGYAMQETSKIPRFLKEIDDCAGNAGIFFDRVEKAKRLNWEIRELETEKKTLQSVVESMRGEAAKLGTQRQQLREQIGNFVSAKEALQHDVLKAQKELEALQGQVAGKSDEMAFAQCVSDIMKSRPLDTDVLYKYAYWLKQITIGAAPEYASRRPSYEAEVRKRLVNTLVEYFKDDLATRTEVRELGKALHEEQELTQTLQNMLVEKEAENTRSKAEIKQLQRRITEMIEESRKLEERVLTDPSIPFESVYPELPWP